MKGHKRDGATYRKILGYLKRYPAQLVLTGLLAVVAAAANLLIPYLTGLAVDTVLGENAVLWTRLYRIFFAIGACVAAGMAAQWFMSLCNHHITYHVLADVRRDAFEKLERLPLKYIDSRAYGEIASVIITDADQFAEGLLFGFTRLFTGVVTICGVLVITFLMRWEIALVVLFVTPLSLFAARFIANRTYSFFKRQSQVRAEETAFIDEMLGNLKTVKAYSHEDENTQSFLAIEERLQKCSLKAIFFSSVTNPVTRFLNAFVYALVVFVGAMLAVKTASGATPFTVGALSSFLYYVNQYTKPFNEISEVVAEFQNALACSRRLFALIDEESEPSDERNREIGRAEGNVCLKDVRFSYDPARPLIEGLNLEACKGKRVAIVGPTGCGKTTIINLLMRFYDVDGGCICLDGEDIRGLKRTSYRKNFGMVLQETWLKRATVLENLRFGRADATDEEVIEAAKLSNAHSFIMRLPEGYRTVIGDEGTLSEGQKQLLCITRIMLCRPPVVILDEATSNIDTRTEMKVQEAFDRLMQGRTCFIVAHRLSTVENADIILVMQAGRIVEQGDHRTLLERGGFYRALWSAQFDVRKINGQQG